MPEKTSSSIPLRQRFMLKMSDFILPEKDTKVVMLGEYLQSEIQNYNPNIGAITEYIQELFLNNGHSEVGKALAGSAHTPRVEILEAILNIPGVDPNYKDKQTGITPFMVAARAGLLPNMKMLHEKGARIHQKDNEGNHALMYALSSDSAILNLPAIRYLLENNLDPYLENKSGVSVDDMVHARHSFSLYKMVEDARKEYTQRVSGDVPGHLRYLSNFAPGK